MIAIPFVVAVAIGLGALLFSAFGVTTSASDVVHCADDDYQRQRPGCASDILAIVLIIVVLGIAGLGPLAGLVEVQR
jgi:hypothetical protein